MGLSFALALGLYVYQFGGWELSTKESTWGEFGDYFGGALNPVVGLAALFALLWTLKLQREELKFSIDELRKTAEAADEQAKAARRQVEIALAVRRAELLKTLYGEEAHDRVREDALLAFLMVERDQGTEKIRLMGVKLRDLKLNGAILRGVNFNSALLAGADLTRADLTGVNFRHASLDGADLREAILTGANLNGADLDHAKNVTLDQLKAAGGDSDTKLPQSFDRALDKELGWPCHFDETGKRINGKP